MFASISRAARLTLAAAVLLPAVFLTGCIGQGQYDRLYETNRSLTARNADLTRERDEARAQADLLRRNYGNHAGAMSELEKQNADLRKQLDQALADYKDLGDRLASMKFGPVDAQTDRALEALAAQFPDLIKYDSSRGMLRFASDLTFDSGSDLVKENAKAALGALAQVLTSSSAANYDVVVEGHTDSQRIANPATAREHKTNRRLSAHRAVSVIGELATLGVTNERMMAAGWGEYRPSVPNTTSGNTPQNRRVEIFLVRSSNAAATTTTEPTTTVTPTPEPEVDMSK
ncbi:putative lipoprotein YiaD [Phycisphaerales bacterium]|nr:putative lipoprotein YiaD [Phycisphaerales bacterium]